MATSPDYSKSKNPDFRDWILLIFLAIVWGSSFILMKRGLDSFSPIQVASLRLAIASLGFAPFIWKAFKNTPRKYYKGIFLMAIFGNALPAFFFAKAQESLYSALAGVLNGLTPIFVLIFGLLFFGQKLYGRQSLGVIAGFAGAVLLVLADMDDVSAYSLSIFSGGLVVLATISYGLSSNVIKHYLQDISPMYSGSLAFAMIAPFAFGLLFSTNFITVLQETEGAWYSLGSLTILALVGTVLASILYIRLVQRTDAVFSASVTYLIPIVAIIWGVFDGELLKTMHYLGLAVILFGVYLSSKKK